MRFSSAQRLQNGNTLICSGYEGKFFEVTQEKEIVWTYHNYYPFILTNKVFQIKRYPSNYSGLGELKENYVYSSLNRILLSKT